MKMIVPRSSRTKVVMEFKRDVTVFFNHELTKNINKKEVTAVWETRQFHCRCVTVSSSTTSNEAMSMDEYSQLKISFIGERNDDQADDEVSIDIQVPTFWTPRMFILLLGEAVSNKGIISCYFGIVKVDVCNILKKFSDNEESKMIEYVAKIVNYYNVIGGV